MLGLVTMIGMCVAGISFCTIFLVAVCMERQRHVVCYVVREKGQERPRVVSSEKVFAIGQAA